MRRGGGGRPRLRPWRAANLARSRLFLGSNGFIGYVRHRRKMNERNGARVAAKQDSVFNDPGGGAGRTARPSAGALPIRGIPCGPRGFDRALAAGPLLSGATGEASHVIRAFGVANRRYAPGTLLDIDTERITDSPGDVPVYGVAYPSVFVIGAKGTVLWRFVSETDELRLTGTAILERSIGAAPEVSRRPAQNGRVQATVTASNTEAGLGNRLWIGLELKMPPGLHIYGPEAGRGYHGLQWRMDASSCWYQNEPAYPKPMLRHFAFEEHDPASAGSTTTPCPRIITCPRPWDPACAIPGLRQRWLDGYLPGEQRPLRFLQA
jgi:hypothetical protein